MTTDLRCEWDGQRTIGGLTLGAGFDRRSPCWVLKSVDDGGASERFVDPRRELEVGLVDGIIISLTCWATFFAPGHADNLIGAEGWELAAAVGHHFEPDPLADVVFEAPAAGLQYVVGHGRITGIWLADYDLIEETDDAPRPVGAG